MRCLAIVNAPRRRPAAVFFEMKKHSGTTMKATTAEYWNTLL